MENSSQINEEITFQLSSEQASAVEKLAGGRQVRFSGKIVDGQLVVDNIGFAKNKFDKAVFAPVNAPFAMANA